MVKKRKESAGNSVPVVLEKGQENSKLPVLQVNPELLGGLKNSDQLARDQEMYQKELEDMSRKDYYKNKALFYAGVIGAVLGLCFIFRYLKSPPPKAIPMGVLNDVVSLVPK
jgi:hypothetical protein